MVEWQHLVALLTVESLLLNMRWRREVAVRLAQCKHSSTGLALPVHLHHADLLTAPVNSSGSVDRKSGKY